MKKTIILTIISLLFPFMALAVSPKDFTGKILLKGEIGEGQDSVYSVSFLGGTINNIKKDSFNLKKKIFNLTLNRPFELEYGVYLINYEGSMSLAEVKINETTVVKLDKIEIKPQGENYQVYVDLLTNKQHQKIIPLLAWVDTLVNLVSIDACLNYKNYITEELCEYRKAKDFNKYSNLYRFTSEGSYQMLDQKCDTHFPLDDSAPVRKSCSAMSWVDKGFVKIQHTSYKSHDSAFVSVFCGTYIIKYNSSSRERIVRNMQSKRFANGCK